MKAAKKPHRRQALRQASIPALNLTIRLMDVFAVATCGYWTSAAHGGDARAAEPADNTIAMVTPHIQSDITR